MKRQLQKIGLAWVAVTLGLISFFLFYWFKSQFTFGNEGHCDAWYSFGVNHNLMSAIQERMTFYRKDRLPSVFPRSFLLQLAGPIGGRYLFYLLLHCSCLLSLALIGKRIFTKATTLLLLLLFAFSPLVFGSYQTDYPAMDSVAWSLWALYFAIASWQATSGHRQNWLTVWVGFFWAMAFFAHFKYGLYAFFIPFLPFAKNLRWPFNTKSLVPLAVSFVLGFGFATLLLALMNKLLFNGHLYFFEAHIKISTMKEAEFNRPAIETLGQSPLYVLYSLLLPILAWLGWRKKAGALEGSIFVGLCLLLLFILSGGVFFVESNYVWVLPPFLLVLGRGLQSLSLSKQSQNLILVFSLLFVPLVFINDLSLSKWALSQLGWAYPMLALLLFAGLLLILSQWRNPWGQGLAFSLLILPLYLIRPDAYGESLFVSQDRPLNQRRHYEGVVKFYELVRQRHSFRYPIIIHDGPHNPLIEDISSSYLQCGKDYQLDFQHFNGFMKSTLKKSHLLAYISPQPDAQKLESYMGQQGYKMTYGGEFPFDWQGTHLKVLFYYLQGSKSVKAR